MLRPSAVLRIPAVKAGNRYVSSFDADSYQFLHKSPLPTYHFQKSLRRLPIPQLKNSCGRYLAAVEAVCSPSQIEEAKVALKELEEKDGPELQNQLILFDRAHKDSSYISEPWFDMYLKSRLPVPINFNPFLMLSPDKRPEYNDQLVRATNMLISCARFKKSLDAEVLTPEVYHLNPKKSDTPLFYTLCRLLPESVSWFGAVAQKAFPLDMSQYRSLFGGNRIPVIGKDRLHLCKKPKHVLIVRNGTFYTVDLFDDQYRIRSPQEIHACLAKILSDNQNPRDNECVGSLTTLERDLWAKTREDLLSSSGKNVESIGKIDDALFVLCLDDTKTTDHAQLANSLLCGGDGRNRWFDKCFQLIIDGNGQATINFEHSWGDGVAVLRLVEEVFKDTQKMDWVKPGAGASVPPSGVSLLNWELPDSVKGQVEDAQRKFVNAAAEVKFSTVQYTGLTRDQIKHYKLSPDSVMQLAIQLAYYRAHKTFVPTYESCSTAAFKKGRTECIRSATSATRDTVLELEKTGKDVTKIKELFKKCSTDHGQLVKDGAMGQGFDRHFLGLKVTAERLGRPLPSIFGTKVHNHMSQFVLSTSTLSTESIAFGGFGPVVRNGYGIGYNVGETRLGAVISAFEGGKDAKHFGNGLEESLEIIKSVLENK